MVCQNALSIISLEVGNLSGKFMVKQIITLIKMKSYNLC